MDISREPSERDLPLLGERSQVASAPSTPRVALLDNAKGALIYCVVLYHVAVVYTGADRPETPVRYASGFLMVLKPVVMPGFCLISGHLSRASLTPKHVRGLYQALATYALFQLLYFGNNALSYWYNGFEMPLLPLQLFQPPQAAVTWFLATLSRPQPSRRAAAAQARTAAGPKAQGVGGGRGGAAAAEAAAAPEALAKRLRRPRAESALPARLAINPEGLPD